MKKNNSKHNISENQDVMTEKNFADTCETHPSGANMSDTEGDCCDKSAEMTAAVREAAEWKDKYLRLSAEYDNYRKRTAKEKLDLVAFGGEAVITALLPVLDDIDRALAAIKSTDDVQSIREGMELIISKLCSTLKSKGLSEIEALGEDLNTDLHDAVAKIQTEKKQKGKVVDIVQKGYKLNDKVVRHAKCVVGE